VSGKLQHVRETVNGAGSSAGALLDVAIQMSGEADRLGQQIQGFLEEMRK
jgi:hypothetical protein